jgi:hypothetical protein
MRTRIPFPVWLLAPWLALQACSGGGSGGAGTSATAAATPAPVHPTAATPTAASNIAQIAVGGAAVKVFDHTKDQQGPENVPDAQITAWREADGTLYGPMNQ